MAISVTQSGNGISISTGKSPTVKIEYIASGSSDRDLILSALADEAESSVLVEGVPLVRKNFEVEEVEGERGVWRATANFSGINTQVSPGEYQESWEFGDDSVHITQSVRGSPVASYTRPGGTSGSHNGAIGVQSDGSVAGTDIDLAALTWTETHIFEASEFTAAYKRKVYMVKMRPVNDAPFRGFAAGEVRFRGASATRRQDGKWELTFKFSASPNATGLVVGDITGIAKNGWEYLWVEYERTDDSTNKVMITRPRAAYVEQVYLSSDFEDLGIGVAE
jgi:hypothetical protein